MIHYSSLRCIPKTLLFGFFCVLATLSQAQIGANWRLRNPKPWSDTLTSVAAISTTRVMATGRGLGLLISDDAGVTWRASRVDFSAEFGLDAYVAHSVNAARQLIVMGNRVFTSTGGDDWTEVATNLGSNETLSLLTVRGSQWFAIKKVEDSGSGQADYFFVSATGTGDTWTEVTQLPLAPGFQTINALLVQNTNVLVGGYTYNSSTGNAQAILLSSTAGGTSWTDAALSDPADSTVINSITTSGSVYVAAGNNNVYRSTDSGATWTRYALTTLDRVAWNGVRFIGATSAGGSYSTDGITWTAATTVYGDTAPLAMMRLGTTATIIAVGDRGSILTTTDGNVWMQRAPTGPTSPLSRFASNPAGIRLAFSYDGTFARSTDGDTWTKHSEYVRAAAWHSAEFIGVNQDDNCLTSTDGITWTKQSMFGVDAMHDIASNGTTAVAVGEQFGTGVIYFSNTPTTSWTSATVPANLPPLRSVIRSGSLWVAVGENALILTSANGSSWTKRTVPGLPFNLSAVAGNSTGTLFVVVGLGSSGAYFTSTNGTAWTRRQLPTSLDITGAVWTGSNFVISTGLNIAFRSTDGINWTSSALPTGNNIFGMGVDATRGEAVILGDAGTILVSDAVPEASFVTTSQSVFESQLTAAVQVNLTTPATSALTIPFTVGGTATDALDYASFAPTSITFAAGEMSKVINVTLVNDTSVESEETIVFTLGTTTGMRLGNITTHTLKIVDDDTPAVGQFVGSEVSVPETAGTIGLQVLLNRPTATAMTIPVSVSGAASADLTLGAPNLTIPAGSSTGFISVTIVPNSSVTSDQSGIVTLGSPNVGGLGANKYFTITVLDQDPATTAGRRWTLRQQQPSADALWALTTIPGGTPRVVAVGEGGTVVTSDDNGATWTKRFTNVKPDVEYNGVHWNGSFVIAGGNGGHIGTSPDGIGWSDQVVSGGRSTMALMSVASSSTRTVIVGGDLVNGDVVPVIFSTFDSAHWSRVALPGGLLGQLRSVIYVSGTTPQFIAVGSLYSFDTNKASTLILTSPDGLSWTDRSAALPGIDLTSVVAAGSTLVAFDGTKSAYTGVIAPADGSIAWTKRTLGALGGLNYGAWNGSKLAAVGEATGTSTNGIAWTQKASPSKNNFNDITWTGSKFIAVAYPAGIYTSTDGVTWTPPATVETSLPLFAVAWSGTQFCAVGGDYERVKTALIYTSPDGVTWTQRASTLKVPLVGITWSGTQFCAVGANGTIVTSPNGITWTTRSSGTPLDLRDVVWGGNQFVAVGGNNVNEGYYPRAGGSIVLTSPNGITWTRRSIPSAHALEGIVFNPMSVLSTVPIPVFGPLFIAVGRSTFDGGEGEAEVLTSTDGINWTHRSSGVTGADLQHVTRMPSGGYAATTRNFGIQLSNDGFTWFPAVLPAAPATSYSNSLRGITLAGSQMIAVGGSGSILTSSNGFTWTTQASQVRHGEIFGVAASPTTIVAVGANASIQTSPVAASAPVPQVNFAQASSAVNESVGSTSILVTLSSPPSVPTSVVFHPSAGTGLVLTGAAADVTVPASPLVFNPGETAKYFTIGIKNDNVEESMEVLTLTLDSVTGGGATVGMANTHMLTIVNDDVAPQLSSFGAGIVLENSTVTLSAGVMAGTQPLTFVWRKNGAALPATVIGTNSPALYFKSVAIADGGTYTCTVSNPAGSATVTVPLGVVRTNAAPYSFAGTTTATLTQPASSNVVCHWFKDASTTEVAAGADFAFNTNKSTLTVKNLATNTGTYACKVELPGFSVAPFGPGYTYTVTTTTAAPILATNPTLPAGVIGNAYSYTMNLFMGSGAVNTWSSPDLASLGLKINPLTGEITGMPTAVVTNKPVTIVATNGKGTATAKPTITITSAIAAFVGTHTGLVSRDPGVNNNLGGIVTFTVNANGTCTGSYTVDGVKVSLLGSAVQTSPTTFTILATTGPSPQSVISKFGNGYVDLSFTYDSARSSNTGAGALQFLGPNALSAPVALFRTWRALSGAANIAPYIGRWNYALRLANGGDIGNQALPQGHGFGSATIPASGLVAHAVKLSDGTSVTASSPLNLDGSSLLFSLLYGGKGSLMTAPQIVNPSSVDSTITDTSASWNKPADTTVAGARNYPAGWAPIALKFEGAKYKYIAGNHVMGLTVPTSYPFVNAMLTFAEGGTQATGSSPDVHLNIKNDGTLDGPIYNLMTGYNPRNASFAITAATGAITGKLDMNEYLNNGFLTTKRNPIAYSAQIVRIFNIITSTFDNLGVGYILLPQLPDLNTSPVQAETATPILSGRVEVKPYP